jgi:hypothetical protein
MAGTITVAEGQEWLVSNWAYRSLMDCVLEMVAGEPPIAQFIEIAKWNHGLDIPAMQQDEPELVGPVLHALKNAAQNCSEGTVMAKVDGRVLDEESQRQFREATNQLSKILSRLP